MESAHNPSEEQEQQWAEQKAACYARWREERMQKAVEWLREARSQEQRLTRKQTLERLVSRRFAADAWATYWEKWRNG